MNVMKRLKDMKADIGYIMRPGRKEANRLEAELLRKTKIAGKTRELKKLQETNMQLARINKLESAIKTEKKKSKELKNPRLTKALKAFGTAFKGRIAEKKAKKPTMQTGDNSIFTKTGDNSIFTKTGDNSIFTKSGTYNSIFHGK